MSKARKDREKRANESARRDVPKSRRAGRGEGVPRALGRRGHKSETRTSATTHGAAAHTEASWLKSKGPVLRFLGGLGLLMALFYALYVPLTQTGLFSSYLETLAGICGVILSVLGQNIDVAGQSISSDTFSLKVVGGCDGLEATALFVAAVVASPVALRRRLWFLLVGIPVFAAINLLRIVSLFYVGLYRPDLVDTIHLDVWPGILIVLVLSCWLAWARWAWRTEDSTG